MRSDGMKWVLSMARILSGIGARCTDHRSGDPTLAVRPSGPALAKGVSSDAEGAAVAADGDLARRQPLALGRPAAAATADAAGRVEPRPAGRHGRRPAAHH